MTEERSPRPVRDILVCGASIAGPASAWWLHRHGFNVTLLEKAATPRPGGHAIDIRGAAIAVIKAMGLVDQVRDRCTQMKGVSRLDADGNEVWRSEELTITGGSFGLEAFELIREDLSRILVGALPDGIEIRYGDHVTAVEQLEDGALVSFDKAEGRRFDLVIGADGLASATRKMVFGPDAEFLVPFGRVLAPFSAPNLIGLEDWQLTYDIGENSCIIYTAPGNETLRVCFGFPAEIEGVPSSRAGQIALVKEKCGAMGWQISNLLAAMESAPDFYLGPIAQVKMPCWTKGNVALVGDAGYCPSPYTGQGSSLAIVGAYVLAGELARSPGNLEAAFAAYETTMRPFVEINQAIADLSRDPRFGTDASFFVDVVEPAMRNAESAVELRGL